MRRSDSIRFLTAVSDRRWRGSHLSGTLWTLDHPPTQPLLTKLPRFHNWIFCRQSVSSQKLSCRDISVRAQCPHTCCPHWCCKVHTAVSPSRHVNMYRQLGTFAECKTTMSPRFSELLNVTDILAGLGEMFG